MNNIDIKNKGYLKLSDIISDFELNKLKEFTLEQIEKYEGKNFRLYENNFDKSIISEKEFNDKLSNLIKSLIETNYKSFINKKPNTYKVLRVVTGKKQKEQANLYHFDAHLITILIPIIIPKNKNDKNGDLVIFPNLRKVHTNLIINIFQKLIFQNIITRKLLSLSIIKRILKCKILKIIPGNIYVFNGFTTLHGNMEIDEGSKRATLLIHAHDVFYNSKLINKNREKSINAEIKNIK